MAAKLQPDLVELPSYQHMLIGLISGAMGPFSNAPIDTIKTRKGPIGHSLQLTLTSPIRHRFAKVTSYARPECVPEDLCNSPRHVASGGLPSVLQGYHPSCAPRRTRTGHCICRVRASEQGDRAMAELRRCRIF